MSSVGVIDIGSNSVRIVIYSKICVAPLKILNEKVLCGLAKDMVQTKRLNSSGIKKAYVALERFLFLAKIQNVGSLWVFATSAVRDAIDGSEFVDQISEKYNIKVNVLSQEEEAKYAAYGVISSIFNPKGLVADLGGGSIEFVSVNNKSLNDIYSFPIGALRGSNQNKSDFIKNALKSLPISQLLSNSTLYAVGGSFRNLAKIYIKQYQYPLNIIHNFRIPANDIYVMLDKISKSTKSVLQNNIVDVSKKRLEVLPYAASVMKYIIDAGKPKDIVFSTCGVREGVVYSMLKDNEIKKEDPLIFKCKKLAKFVDIDNNYGYELLEWLLSIFPKVVEDKKRILFAICILSDIVRDDNSSYKADLVYNKIMDASFVSVDHSERVFIAKTLFFRYKGSLKQVTDVEKLFLTREEVLFAYRIGLSIRLATSLSNNCENVLKNIPIKIEDDNLVLKLKGEFKSIIGEIIEKRLNDLAESLNCYPAIRVYKD